MRDVNSLPGLHSVSTMFSAKKRAIPGVHRSVYLDLFMLGKEKERILKEDERQCRLMETNKKRLEAIGLEINKLQGAQTAIKADADSGFSKHTLTQKEGIKKEWKTMSLNY
ncbi:MAG: ankyrin [Actinobacteria bacterium]|nr:ankyrin [Actinomycetota bacterium]MCG2679396.1 ankyrin [Kiritimatiellia bacterium]